MFEKLSCILWLMAQFDCKMQNSTCFFLLSAKITERLSTSGAQNCIGDANTLTRRKKAEYFSYYAILLVFVVKTDTVSTSIECGWCQIFCIF